MRILPRTTLEQFRSELYDLFAKRSAAIMDLLDALTADGYRYASPTALTNSIYLRRKYASVTRAIAAFSNSDWNLIMKLIIKYTKVEQQGFVKYAIDVTPEARQFASTMPDRQYVHSPNAVAGNKPVTIGQDYSVIAQLTNDKHWVVPLDVRRVRSNEKGNEVGVQQLLEATKNKECCGVLGVGDSLYGSVNCRQLASTQNANLTYLFRLKRTRTLYRQPSDTQIKRRGRKVRYGEAVKIADDIHPDSVIKTTMQSSTGEVLQIQLECLEDVLLRGTHQFPSYNYPLRVIKATVTGENSKTKFSKPLCLAVQGGKRHILSALDIYQSYRSRYDIEHFFRYGKQRLLFNSFQTTDVQHADNWHKICLLAYVQLYLARQEVSVVVPPWMKYATPYKDHKSGDSATPSMTQQAFAKLLSEISSPAHEVRQRGIPPGRKLGETQQKREKHPPVKKGTSISLPSFSRIICQFEKKANYSNSQIYQVCANWMQKGAQKTDFSLDALKNILSFSP